MKLNVIFFGNMFARVNRFQFFVLNISIWYWFELCVSRLWFANNLDCNRFRKRGWRCHLFFFFPQFFFYYATLYVSEPTRDSVRFWYIYVKCVLHSYDSSRHIHSRIRNRNSKHARSMHRQKLIFYIYYVAVFVRLVRATTIIWIIFTWKLAAILSVNLFCLRDNAREKYDHKKRYLCSFNTAMCVSLCVCVCVWECVRLCLCLFYVALFSVGFNTHEL